MLLIRTIGIALIWVWMTGTLRSETVETITLPHASFEQDLAFSVHLPDGYMDNPDKRYVLYFDFDSKAQRYLGGIHHWLSFNGEWPWLQSIIVTPAPGNMIGTLFDESGNTTPIIDFIGDNLIPELEKRYRLNAFRIFSGFRVNGTLVLSALLHRPQIFDAYIAVNPEVKDNLAGVSQHVKNHLPKLDGNPRFLYLSTGENIKVDHQFAELRQLISDVEQYAPASLTLHSQTFSDTNAMALPLLSVIRAIELMFDDIHSGLSPTSEISQQGVSAIKAHYQFISEKKYGFPVSPQDSIIALANYDLKNNPQKGLAILKQNTRDYPQDAYAHHALAQAYMQLGQYQDAVNAQTTAAQLAETMLTWHSKRMKRFLAEYQQKLVENNIER